MVFDFSIHQLSDIWYNDDLKNNMQSHLENNEHVIMFGENGHGKTTIMRFFTSQYVTYNIIPDGNNNLDNHIYQAIIFIQTNLQNKKCVCIDGLSNLIEKGIFDIVADMMSKATKHGVSVIITCSDKKRKHKKVSELIKRYKFHTYILDQLNTKKAKYWRTLQILKNSNPSYDVSREMKTRIWNNDTHDVRNIVQNIMYNTDIKRESDNLFDTTMFSISKYFFTNTTLLKTIMNSQRTDTHNVSLICHWNAPYVIRKIKKPYTEREKLKKLIDITKSISKLDLMDYIISSTNKWDYQFLCNALKIHQITKTVQNMRNKSKTQLTINDIEFTRLITYWSKRLSKNKLEYIENKCHELGVSSSYSIETVYALRDEDKTLYRLTQELENL